MPTEQFITTEQLIGRALDRGVELGPNPHQTIEIYIQQGLIPGKLVNGMHPANVVDRLVAIQNLLAQGKNLEEIRLLIKQERRNFLSKAGNLTSLVNVYKSSSKGLLMLVSLATLVLFSFTIISKTPGTFAKEALQNGGLIAQEAAKPAGLTLAAILRTAKSESANSTDPLGLTNINKVITINEKQEVVIEKTIVSSSPQSQTSTGGGNFVLLDENSGIKIDGDISIGGVFSGNGSGLTNLNLPSTLLYSDQTYSNPVWLSSLDWTKLINRPNLVSSVDGVKNDLGDISFVAGAGVTITPNDTNNTITFTLAGSGVNADLLDSLDSTAFLRSDTSDNFTSGTLTFDAGTTLSVLGAFTCTNCVGDAAIPNTITASNYLPLAGGVLTGGLTVAGVAGLIDADIPNVITVGAGSSVAAATVNSGTLGNAGVTLALASFGSITGSLADANVADTITASSYLLLAGGTMAGNINSNNNLVLNIGAAGTDFTAGGGLNIATDLDVNGHGAFGSSAGAISASILNLQEDVTGESGYTGLQIYARSSYNVAGPPTVQGILAAGQYHGTINGFTAIGVEALGFYDATSGAPSGGTLIGVKAYASTAGATVGSVTDAYGVQVSLPQIGAIIPTNSYGIRVTNQGLASITNTYGLYIDNQTGSTNNYGIYVNNAGTQAIWVDAGTSRFDGLVSVGLGGTASTTAVCSSLANATAPTGGTAYELRDCSGAPAADYMEMYSVASGVDTGDIVVTSNDYVLTKDGDRLVKLAKSSAAYQGNTIGIVSNPSDAGDFNSVGYNINASDNPMPVALAGRVKAKVSGENGPIQAGDPITSSSAAGVGMKATSNGPIIGRALESFSGAGEGKILVFANAGWYTPTETQTVNQLVVNLTNAANFEWKGSLGQTVAWVNHLGEALFSRVTATVGDFQTLVFGELKVKSGSQVSGQAVLSGETNEVFVPSDKVQADSLITLTPNSEPNGILYVKSKTASQGFTVGIKKLESSTSATSFTWLIVNHE